MELEMKQNEAVVKKLNWTILCAIALITTLMGCVEPIDFEVPEPKEQIIIQGTITDQPGPYTVTIGRGISLRPDSVFNPPITGAQVRLYDDQGNIENFSEVSPGEYVTIGAIRGTVGRSYHITVELSDGSTYESQPDLLKPVGEIQDIYWEYESETSEEVFGEVQNDFFNIYIDSDIGQFDQNFVRWRMSGTYRIVTNPELFEIDRPWFDFPIPRPRPCSGFEVAPAPVGNGTIVVQKRPCTCCECWVDVFEKSPVVSDDRLVANGQFKNVKVGEVPINNVNFYDKFLVNVEQMSLTRTAYDFFRLIEVQRNSASSIFQPPSGEIVGNMIGEDEDDRVIGLFWASSIVKRYEFIQREDVPYLLTPTQVFPESCLLQFENSTTERPDEW